MELLPTRSDGAIDGADASAGTFGVRFEGEGDGGRPMRARWEGVSGMSENVSFAREGKRGRRARERFRRR